MYIITSCVIYECYLLRPRSTQTHAIVSSLKKIYQEKWKKCRFMVFVDLHEHEHELNWLWKTGKHVLLDAIISLKFWVMVQYYECKQLIPNLNMLMRIWWSHHVRNLLCYCEIELALVYKSPHLLEDKTRANNQMPLNQRP